MLLLFVEQSNVGSACTRWNRAWNARTQPTRSLSSNYAFKSITEAAAFAFIHSLEEVFHWSDIR